MTKITEAASPSSNSMSFTGRPRTRGGRSVAAFVSLSLLVLGATTASAQTSEPRPDADEPRISNPGSVVTAQPPTAPRAGVTFDTSDVHTFDGDVKGSSGSSVSSTSLYARLAPRVPIGEHLTLSFPLDAALSFYAFSGNPLSLPLGGEVWDQVRAFSIGAQAHYSFDRHWALLVGANGASAGTQGASFNQTLTEGGTLGFSYTFSRALTLGFGVTAQSQLAGGPYVLPFPVIDWRLPFDGGRWQLEAGAVRAGPGRAAGVSLAYTPSEALSFNLGLAAPGLGREFRLASSNGVTGGVGRDSAFPLTFGVRLRPMKPLTVSLYGGLSLFHKVTVLDSRGNTLDERDVKPAPELGGQISLAL